MHESTLDTFELLESIRDAIADEDLEAARFLRDGVHESIQLGTTWLTPEEAAFLDSF